MSDKMRPKDLLLKAFMPQLNAETIVQKQTPVQEARGADPVLELAAQKTYMTPDISDGRGKGAEMPQAQAMGIGKWGQGGPKK